MPATSRNYHKQKVPFFSFHKKKMLVIIKIIDYIVTIKNKE